MSLITTIAAGFTCAWVLGLITQKLRLSPIVGYLLAGVVIGPHSPGFVGDLHIAHQLAEIGVILLMFGVGLHFHLKDLLAVKNVAIPGAVGQSLAATLIAMLVFSAFGLPLITSAVIGMAMAVASTVVLMRVLMDAEVLNSPQGHVAVGWLIVEDIFTVVLLVLIPVMGSSAAQEQVASLTLAAAAAASEGNTLGLWPTLGLALAKLAVLVGIILFAGSRVVPWVLVQVAKLRSRELFTLTVLVLAIAIATGSYYFFGASMALGAFLAGMVVAQSPVSHQAAADALPMRDAFAVLFFVSVGMLFNPMYIIEKPVMILAGLGIILLIKPLAALAIVALLGHSARTALTVALGLAQIGEFSFILSDLAKQHGLMPAEGHNLIVGSAIISIVINPLLFRCLPQIESWLRKRPLLWKLLNGRAENRIRDINHSAADIIHEDIANGKRLAIVVGFGPVGRSVHRLLKDAELNTVIIDLNMDTILDLNAQGQTAVYGDASHESILEQAGVKNASHFILTLPHSADRAGIVSAVRHLNPQARILVRAHYLREREELELAGATAAVFEEAEAAVGLARIVLADTGVQRETAERKVRDLRLQLIQENMSTIRSQRVRSVMMPWTRVRRLTTSASRQDVQGRIAEQRFSRWPVVDSKSGRCIGYLLAKDLIAYPTANQDWQQLVRTLHTVDPDDTIEATLVRMQSEGATVYLVEAAGKPLGLITLEDILEQVVGRIEDEYPHEPRLSLRDTVAAGGIILELQGHSCEQVIAEMAAVVPPEKSPPNAHIADLALTRESEFSTDLGNGVAIPHARCPNLSAPLIVFGRSTEGFLFSPTSTELVHFVFLLVTPTDQPDIQLSLLGQLASIAGDDAVRAKLSEARVPSEVLDALPEMPQEPQPV